MADPLSSTAAGGDKLTDVLTVWDQDGEEVGWSRPAALPDSEQNQNQIECNVTWETRLDQPRRVCRARMANERPSRQGPTNQRRDGGEGGGVIRGLGECVWSCCWDGRGLPNKWGILDEILPYYSCGMSRDVNHSLLQLGQNCPNWNIILIQSKTRVGTTKRDNVVSVIISNLLITL